MPRNTKTSPIKDSNADEHTKTVIRETLLEEAFVSALTEKITATFVAKIDELNCKIKVLEEELKIEKQEKQELNEELREIKVRVNLEKDRRMTLEKEMDDTQQYLRRNNILIHGIAETDNENTDELVADILFDKMSLPRDYILNNISRSHRLGPRRAVSINNKPRPVIIQFFVYNVKNKIYWMKKMLKGSGLLLTESLTKLRFQLLKKTYSHEKVKFAWTSDGRIFSLSVDGQKLAINNEGDLQHIR